MKRLLGIIFVVSMLLSLAVSVSAEGTAFENTIDWDAEYDAVVAGFGGAGGTAAITAADARSKVLLLEKGPEGHAGGNTRYAAQLIMTPIDREEALEYWKALRGDFDHQSDAVVELIVDGSMAIPEWLVEMGADPEKLAKFPFAEYAEVSGSSSIYATIVNGGTWSSELWKLIYRNVTERPENIDVWYAAPAVHLIQDPATKIIHGVEVEQNGQILKVRAKNGVVMAVGGFENNEDMIENFTQMPEGYSKGARYNTGDGVKMAIEVGADLWHMSTLSGPDVNFVIPETGVSAGYNINAQVSKNMFTGFAQGSCLMIGGDGTRFIDETTSPSHGHVNNHGTWVSQQIPKNSWMVFDSTNTRSIYLSFSEGNREEIEKGWIIKADTLEELAEMMDVPVKNFLKTVEKYNGYCAKGFDEEFGIEVEEGTIAYNGTQIAEIVTHPEYLVPISEGPFYALPLKPTFTNTQGGARRNENCEILNTQGNPIPHLYSAGEFGSFYADIYNGGGNLAECIFSGRIAGANAAAVKNDATAENLLTKEAYDGRVKETEIVTAENEYIGIGVGMAKLVVKVTMDGDTIKAVEVIEQSETVGIGDKAIAAIPDAIVAAQSTQVDTITGATVTSKAIINAVDNALSNR